VSDWQSRYSDKVTAPEEAVRLIEDGMTIHFGLASACPQMLTGLIGERREELRDVLAYGDLMTWEGDWDEVLADEHHIEMRCCFITRVNRPAYARGRTAYHPATVYTSARRFERDIGPPDIAYLRLGEPDENGNCSVGSSVWDTKIAARAARVVVAEIALEGMPRTSGDSTIHVEEIDYLVPIPDTWLARGRQLGNANEDPEQLTILDVAGANTAELVRDGDTLEIGVGSASNAVSQHLWGKQDLGYHSELTGPGIVPLFEAGVFNGRKKSRDVGKMVVTALPGDLADQEVIARYFDEWELYGVDYIHNPAVIASQSQMTSINTAIMIDLTGQIVFDSVGRRMHTGPGGQIEFVIGAVYAPGGRSMHVLPSMSGENSRIVSELPPGANVGIPRYLADYVITEYGVASMFGKSERARAEELIAIAHPDLRAALRAEARHAGLL
jgi:4-hydroxybutyrate CoA-transferase